MSKLSYRINGNPPNSPSHCQKGFTIIEMLVVIAVLGILAAYIVPHAIQFLNSAASDAAQTELKIVQDAVNVVMHDNSLTTIPGHLGNNTDDMQKKFPSDTYGLYPDYLRVDQTRGRYSVTLEGEVTQTHFPR